VVERNLAKVEVASSTLVSRSNISSTRLALYVENLSAGYRSGCGCHFDPA
jgi:hypothetical protein